MSFPSTVAERTPHLLEHRDEDKDPRKKTRISTRAVQGDLSAIRTYRRAMRLKNSSIGHRNLQRLSCVIQVNGEPVGRILTLERSCSVDPFGNQLIRRSYVAHPRVLQSKTMLRSRQIWDGRIMVCFSRADEPDQLIVNP